METDDDEYLVDEIRGMMVAADEIKYLVKWSNYSISKNTWEPPEHINESLIEFFKDRVNWSLKSQILQEMESEFVDSKVHIGLQNTIDYSQRKGKIENNNVFENTTNKNESNRARNDMINSRVSLPNFDSADSMLNQKLNKINTMSSSIDEISINTNKPTSDDIIPTNYQRSRIYSSTRTKKILRLKNKEAITLPQNPINLFDNINYDSPSFPN
eukprot:NODE_749_length_4582_cov_0.475797.p2 type:complete len:214 gc:universal NODE_749_length_4582_cov_0.475797:648-1289(+)